MAEENKNQEGQVGNGGQVNQEPTRSESRQKDLADKLAEQERIYALEREEMQRKLAEAQQVAKEKSFETDLLMQSQKFPHAMDFKNEIKSYVDKGLNTEEATTLVLGKNNKLFTPQDISRSRVEPSSFGGSVPTLPQEGSLDPTKMTQEERRKKLEGWDREGKFTITPNGGLSLDPDAK